MLFYKNGQGFVLSYNEKDIARVPAGLIPISAEEARSLAQARCPAPEATYIENRLRKYPAVSDQLDMLYKDMINGTNNWVDLIKSIKEEFPK